MSRVSRARLAKVTVRLLREQPARQREILRKVAAYMLAAHMAENGRVKGLDLLMKDFARELQAQEGRLYAEVRSAFEMSDALRNELVSYLQDKTGAKSVELSETVDPSLISGLIITTADYEIDLSARRKLKQLASLNAGGN